MLALRAQSASSPLVVETVAIPDLGPEDVLIKVFVAGISPGVIRHLRIGRAKVPSTLGHEAAGTVAAFGKAVTGLTVGSRVRVHPMLSCQHCHHCKTGGDQMCNESALMGFARLGSHAALYEKYHNGGIAEYMRVPHWLVDPLPDNVSFEVATKIHDVGTVLRVLKLADLPQDSTIVVSAATGTMGTLTLRLAEHFPIKKIILIGRSKERLENIQGLTSVETAICPLESVTEAGHSTGALVQQLREQAPKGINAILDYMPSGDLIGKILPALSTGGTLVHIGGNISQLQIPLVAITSNCWRIKGSRASSREDSNQILSWLSDGRLDIEDLITHRFNIKEIDKALEMLETRTEPVWLSVIQICT